MINLFSIYHFRQFFLGLLDTRKNPWFTLISSVSPNAKAHLKWMRICLVVFGEFKYLNWRSSLHSSEQTSSSLESILLLHEAQQIYDTATVAKFVVIPGDKFDKCVRQLDTSLGIKYGRSLVPSEISRDNVFIAVTHDTLHWTFGSSLDSFADVLI